MTTTIDVVPKVLPPDKILTPSNVRLFAGLRVVETKEVVNNGLCLALYGPGGCGKTTIAGMICRSKYSKRTLHCDVEGGASAISHLPVDTIAISKWGDLTDIGRAFEVAKPDELPYDTVILDNMSEIQNLSIRSIAGANAQPEIQHWGRCTADMLRLTRFWRDMSRFKGVNVIFITWEETEKEEATGSWKNHVFFTPKLAAQFPGIVTWIGRVQAIDRLPTHRRVSFTASPKSDAKFRVAPDEAAAAIPLEHVFPHDAPLLADMLDTIRDGTKWPVDRYKPPARQAS